MAVISISLEAQFMGKSPHATSEKLLLYKAQRVSVLGLTSIVNAHCMPVCIEEWRTQEQPHGWNATLDHTKLQEDPQI